MAGLALLGFSSGIPFYLTSRTLQAWLTADGIGLTAIGLFSLVSLPYSLKFLWAPFLDRFHPLGAGRRKGWLLVTQAALVAAVAAMALADPRSALSRLAIAAAAVAFFSATQDIVIDAYRTDVLPPDLAPAGAAVHVLGYRAALIVTGSLALALADPANRFSLSWPGVYAVLAGLIALAAAACLRLPEPLSAGAPTGLREAVVLPFRDFFARKGARRAALILTFIFLFRIGDFILGNMTTPFLLSAGFSQTDVAAMLGGLGLLATIAGALAGGELAARIGVVRCLWVTGVLQAASNLAYFVLAQAGPHKALMTGAIVIENFCSGLGTAAFVGFLMGLCNPRFSATQYALLSSLMAAGRDVLVSPAGAVAGVLGWPGFFAFSFAAALPGLLLLPFFAPWSTTPDDGRKN